MRHALYGLSHRNRGQFFAIDLATGKTLWTTPGREGENASIIAAGVVLLLSTTNAELIVARANPARFEEIKRYTIAEFGGVGASSGCRSEHPRQGRGQADLLARRDR